MSRPGNYALATRRLTQHLLWNKSGEPSLVVRIERSQDITIASGQETFIDEPLVLRIAYMWQNWSHCYKCRNANILQVFNGEHSLIRGRCVRLYITSGIPTT